MTNFDHFIRFFDYSPNRLDSLPTDALRVYQKHPTMPMVGGDTLRFLVHPSVLGPLTDTELANLFLYLTPPKQPTDGRAAREYREKSVGKIRRQDGAGYSEIRLRVSAAARAGVYSQFALCYTDPVTKLETPILGTFRGQQTTLEEYIDALRDHYANYAYTPVTVDVLGNELVIRAYHSDRFRLGHTALRVGLGTVVATNTNQPGFSLVNAGTLTKPAQDVYSVAVGDDIEAGNVFVLNGVSYPATGTETPQDILAALNVASGELSVGTGISPGGGLRLGSVTTANNNVPGLMLQFDATLAQVDYYRVSVTDNVTEGNAYQVAIDGQPTRAKIAAQGDNRASIEAYFNSGPGNARLPCPQGKLPVATATPGIRTTANTNGASLTVRLKAANPAQVVTRYIASISNSIKRGNTFTLGATVVRAPADTTTPAEVAALLGQSNYPFAIDVPSGQAVPIAYAEAGPAYSADQNLASVEVLAGSIWRPSGPLVCEVEVPADLPAGRYQLALCPLSTYATTPFLNIKAVSTPLELVASATDTMLLVYGPGELSGAVMGYEYNEPGLMQQLRIRLGISTGRNRQKESWAMSLDKQPFRTSASSERLFTLTTTAQPEAFHRALYLALKHPQVYLLDPAEAYRRTLYRCEGEYKQMDLGGSRRLQQGQTELIEVNSLVTDVANGLAGGMLTGAAGENYAMGRVQVETIDLPGGIAVYLENTRTGAVRQIKPGSLISPGAYRLRVRGGPETLYLIAFVNNIITFITTIATRTLNRTDEVLVLESESVLSLTAMPLTTITLAQGPLATNRLPYKVRVSKTALPAERAFSNEFNADFN